MNQEVSVVVRETERCTFVHLRGDVTKQAEDALLGARPWQDGLEGGKRRLVIDFTEVPYVNSAGIAVLIRLVRLGLKSGFRTFAYGVNAHYQKLFRMVGLTEYMAIYPDEYAVLQRIEEEEEEA
ncbi:STAS domain-containing protein [Paenibacillus sp.]|uniref:STAS domain-containing protein n=1 Tax=Paenibacillus sp. TaxID=58172 RepID=UPI002D5003F5|nr:STAS domain-containing protein [Paenibacillus sp.]HZG88356.1 STAS domain-containing protein [Paenibacillus sp.]